MNRVTRLTSIELLRILAIFGVIIQHYNLDIAVPAFGRALFYVEHKTLNEIFLYFLESLSVCAVDLFVLISGYFSCTLTKRSAIKPIKLLFQVVIFNYISWIKHIILGDAIISVGHLIKLLVPCSYFVTIYTALYFVSPFINVGLKKFNEKTFRKMIIIIFLLFSVEPCIYDFITNYTGRNFNGLCTISFLSGSGSGYTFVNFMLMYLIGAFLRNFTVQTTKLKLCLGIIFTTILITCWQYFLPDSVSAIGDAYHNPLVILNAALIFLLFRNMSLKQSLLINRLSAASFTVFLSHSLFMQYFDIKAAVARPLPLLLLHIIFTGMICYIFGYIIYVIYTFATEWLFTLITKKHQFYIEATER